jgi:hypothetical protein
MTDSAEDPKPLDAPAHKLIKLMDSFRKDVFVILCEAFEAGKVIGREHAASELRAKVAGILDAPFTSSVPYAVPLKPGIGVEPSADAKRAERGTVIPTVIETLKAYGEPGLKPSEIATRTGLNENSVRGALNKLAHGGVTRKNGDLWLLAAHE